MENVNVKSSLLGKYIIKEKSISYCNGCSSSCLADGCNRISYCSCDTNCSDTSGGC